MSVQFFGKSTLVAADIPALDTSKITTGTFATAFFADNSITINKFQQVSTNTILGRASVGAGNIEQIACTAFARSILDDADALTVRQTIGLGTIATQNETNVAFSGGSATLGTLNISGQTIVLNRTGGASTATASGLHIEEASLVTGYFRVGNNRASMELKSPANSGIIRFSPSSSAFVHSFTFTNTAARTLTLPDADLNLNQQPANLIYASPNGIVGMPLFRALNKADLSTFDGDVRATPLTGLLTSTNAPVVATDSLIVATGKLQAQISPLIQTARFRATAPDTGAHQALTALALNKVSLPNELLDTTNQYASASSRIVASGNETWDIGCYLSVNFSANTRIIITLYKNGVELTGSRLLDIGVTTVVSSFGMLVNSPNISLVANDFLEVYIYVSASGCSIFAGENKSFWFGNRIA